MNEEVKKCTQCERDFIPVWRPQRHCVDCLAEIKRWDLDYKEMME